MSYPERAALALVLFLLSAVLLEGCKTVSESENHMAASAANTLDATGHSETHVEEAPSKVTTTVEEFAPLSEEVARVAGASSPPSTTGAKSRGDGSPKQEGYPTPHGSDPSSTTNVPEHGPLVKRTVTISERGPVSTSILADVKSQDREDSTLSSESESKKSRDFLHGPLTWIGALVALAGLVYGALKLRKVIP